MDAPASDNLYMKGLPAGIAEDTLRAIFGSYGTVISARVLPAPPGIIDAAALVRMSSLQEAQWLVENSSSLASTLSMNLQIRFAVNTKLAKSPAVPLAPPAPHGQASNKLYMRGLPLGIAEERLRAIMSAYGTVLSCKVLPPLAGANDSAAIVQMGDTEQAQWLVDNVNGNIPQGLSTPVVVKFKSEGPSTQGPTPVDQLTAAALAAVSAGVAQQLLPGGQPSDNLYMCGFPPGTTEERLKAVFGAYGAVISCKVLPPPAGKSDSACLMRMGSIEEAQWLVEHVNGNIPQGMAEPITIRFADKSRAAFGAAPAPLPAVAVATSQSSNLYMKGFPPETDDSTLRAIFGQYGVVLSCRVMPTISGGNDVAALVQMGNAAEAQWLVDNVNGNIPQGLAVPIQIRFANNPKGTGKWPIPAAGDVTVPRPPPTLTTQATWLPVFANGGGPLLTTVDPSGPSENLYIKGFPLGTTPAVVRQTIGQYGKVVDCKLLTLPPGHNCSAWFLQMSSVEEAMWLVDNLNENIPMGYSDPVEVRFYPNFAAPLATLGRSSPY